MIVINILLVKMRMLMLCFGFDFQSGIIISIYKHR
jgi:hypothetical protein